MRLRPLQPCWGGRWDRKCLEGFDRKRTYLSAFLFATETQQTIGARTANRPTLPWWWHMHRQQGQLVAAHISPQQGVACDRVPHSDDLVPMLLVRRRGRT